jgi:hypothetical protein
MSKFDDSSNIYLYIKNDDDSEKYITQNLPEIYSTNSFEFNEFKQFLIEENYFN